MSRPFDLDAALREHLHATPWPPAGASELQAVLAPIVALPQRRGRPRLTWLGGVGRATTRTRARTLVPVMMAILGTALLGVAIAVVGARLLPSPTPVHVPAGPMTMPRADASSIVLPDGRALVIGGWSMDKGDALASVDVWDPRSTAFSPSGSMTTGRSFATATVLRDGRVLVTGGHDGGRYRHAGWFPGTPSADLFDPATGTFAPTAPMLEGRSGHTATLLPDGRVLVVGGYGPRPGTESWASDDAGALDTAEIHDPTTGTWSETGAMAGGRYLHWAVPVTDGILVVGGLVGREQMTSPTHGSVTSAEAGPPQLFDLRSGTFSKVVIRRTGSILVTAPLPDGRALLVGLADDASGTATIPWAVALDASSGAVEELDPPGVAAVGEHGPGERLTATVLSDGRIFIVGLRREVGGWSADLFDPATRAFSPTGLGPIRSGGIIAPLASGAVLIAGGVIEDDGATVRAASDAAIIGDPVEGTAP